LELVSSIGKRGKKFRYHFQAAGIVRIVKDFGSLKHIAIIEDDAVLRRGLKLVFSENDFEVRAFTDVTGVFEYFTEKAPDIILCDYKLPSTNGVEILKTLRTNDRATPFFLMTGYYKEDLALLAKENGANEVFEKPLDLEKLISSCQLAVSSPKNGER